ncbi:hypothetical protein BDR05DRAFT_992922 [Suillus weaverae]|nr:hypothetical protein BDR05DRAFT_992922 [Suillus weaverae]
MTIPGSASTAPAPANTGMGAFFAVTHDPEPPATLGHVKSAARPCHQRRGERHIIVPPVMTPLPPVAASTAPSRVTQHVSNGGNSVTHTARSPLAQQQVHDLRQKNAKLAKSMIWADEKLEHDLKRNDMNWDASCAHLDEAIEHRKHRKIADAWRMHIFEERKGKTWEQRRDLDKLLKEGPPPGWKPA